MKNDTTAAAHNKTATSDKAAANGAAENSDAPQAADVGVPNHEAAEEAAKRAGLEHVREVVKLAQAGDRSALPHLRKALDEHPECFQHPGDLALMAQQAWLELLAGPNLYLRETVERKLTAMRLELAGPNPLPLENLMVERVVACWLQVNLADTIVTAHQSQSATVRQELEQRQGSAQRRYFDAIKHLAQLRKMLQPSARTKSKPCEDPLLAGRPANAANAPVCDDPLLAAFAGAAKVNTTQDPLAASHLGGPKEPMFVLDFPRISKEREADSLVHGVGIVN